MASTLDGILRKEDSSIYENVLPAIENQTKCSTTQDTKSSLYATKTPIYSSKLRSLSKITKSKCKSGKIGPQNENSDQPANKKSDLKTTNDNLPAKHFVQVTKSLKVIAGTLLIGLVVLSVAVGLIIYFVAVKAGDEKPSEDTVKPALPVVKIASDIPRLPLTMTSCEIVSTRLPEFEFHIYGSHAVKAIGYFFDIKKQYLYHEAKIGKRKKLNFQPFRLLLNRLLEAMMAILEVHGKDSLKKNSNPFKYLVGKWIRCMSRNPSYCENIAQMIKSNITALAKLSTEAKVAAFKFEESFRSIGDKISSLDILRELSQTLLLYLNGFSSYFKSLQDIASFMNKKIARYLKAVPKDFSKATIDEISAADEDKFYNVKAPTEFACFAICEEAFIGWTKPMAEILKRSIGREESTEKSQIENLVNNYQQLVAKLRNTSDSTRQAIYKEWHIYI